MYQRFAHICFITLLLLTVQIKDIQANEVALAEKILLTTQQSTLTQKMAKASCFIGTFSKVPQQLKTLQNDLISYDENQYRLIFGDIDLGFRAEGDQKALDLITTSVPTWKLVKFAADLTLNTWENPGLDVDMMEQFNPVLLKYTETLTHRTLETKAPKSTFFNTLIQMARLGVLLQKSTKEFCYVSYGLNGENNRHFLKKTVQDFNLVITQLLEGDLTNNILAPVDDRIHRKLSTIKNIWLSLEQLFLKTASRGSAHSRDFIIAERINEPLLIEINDTIKLFMTTYQTNQNTFSREPS